MNDLVHSLNQSINQAHGIIVAGRDPELLTVLCLGVIFLLLFMLSIAEKQRTEEKGNRARTDEIFTRLSRLEAALGGLEEEAGDWKLGDEPPTLGVGKKKSDLISLDVSAKDPEPSAAKEAVVEQDTSATVFRGLQKTRSELFVKLSSLFAQQKAFGPELYESLEELLIASDLGVGTARKLLSDIEAKPGAPGQWAETDVRRVLKETLEGILQSAQRTELLASKVEGKPQIVLVVGVNGVGKTTTVGKLANSLAAQGSRVLVGACDTFRAAAVEQLVIWGERAGVDVVTAEDGAKPTTVAYKAVHKAQDEGYDVVLLDTAGRLHTRVNLMKELTSVVQMVSREQPGAPHETLLVLDASTGQNALQQAREFHQKAALTGIVITKLDGTPKGGIVVAIKDELNVPIRYVGVGEGIDDLKPFSAPEFVSALLDEEGGAEAYQRATERRRKAARQRRRQ